MIEHVCETNSIEHIFVMFDTKPFARQLDILQAIGNLYMYKLGYRYVFITRFTLFAKITQ